MVRFGRVGIVLGAVLGAVGAGCTCGPAAPVAEVETGAVLPDALVQASWPVAMATEADFEPYARSAGWVGLIMQRNIPATIPIFGREGGDGLARVHAESAMVWRQAALLAASSLVQTYGETPQPTDPVGVAHLLTVSYALLGRLDDAKAASARLTGVDDVTAAWHQPWKAWLDAGGTWPPDLAALPIGLPAPTPGTDPEVPTPPHYDLPEQGEGAGSRREMADPGLLVAMALWHDVAARTAAPALAPALDVFEGPYHWPVEAPVAGREPLPMSLVFGGDFAVPGDGPFLAELLGPAGPTAIETWADRSVVAALLRGARAPDGKVDAPRLVEEVGHLRERWLAAASARTAGEVLAHQRQFTDIAAVGTLRNLALAVERLGDHEGSGVLRIAALEQSSRATAWPPGMMAQAAWDAANRYPARPAEILHAQLRHFPALESARYALDVLALRVGRERPGEGPGM